VTGPPASATLTCTPSWHEAHMISWHEAHMISWHEAHMISTPAEHGDMLTSRLRGATVTSASIYSGQTLNGACTCTAGARGPKQHISAMHAALVVQVHWLAKSQWRGQPGAPGTPGAPGISMVSARPQQPAPASTPRSSIILSSAGSINVAHVQARALLLLHPILSPRQVAHPPACCMPNLHVPVPVPSP
jgi:hypothetical protein